MTPEQDAERAALCWPAHPMVAAAYREIISRWVRQRRERRVIEAEREVAYRLAREAAVRREVTR